MRTAYLRIAETLEALDAPTDDAPPRLDVLAETEEDSGWCARLTRLDPEYTYMRIFCVEEATEPGEGPLVYKRYSLPKAGVYQVHAPQIIAPEEFVFLRHDGTSIETITESRAQEILRGVASVTFADVETACMHHDWPQAMRAALNLTDAEERRAAISFIWERRDELEASGWVALEGTERQRRWAAIVRDRAAVRLTDMRHEILVRIEDHEDADRQTIQALLDDLTDITRAAQRVRTERRAAYWISQRFELEAPTDRFLFALIRDDA